MTMFSTIRLRAAALLAGFALALSGCFMAPGKFTSELALTGPDSFTFRYDGEIFFLGLSKLAQMGAAADTESFSATCFNDETFEERACTPEEEADQRAEWDAGAARRAEEKEKEAKQMAAMMGGIDPADPKAAEELVRLLERQKGWNRVVHKGDGLFEVSYAVSGTLGHDFLFPMIEGFPATNPFVQMILREGGQVRINAPAFAAQSGDNPMAAMMGGVAPLANIAAMEAAAENGVKEDEEQIPGMPVLEGTFSIRTAPGMRILANNTDEGPEGAIGAGEVLRWAVSPRSAQAPTALIATGG
ncbi:hypothetical protein [Erythrobacter dokdonensis]|uniref:Lipoprotein n=1 Tax=Erythrobacter dokdonensis DSW-74 TaxID=1300349 RepID=A0A1A7BK92_9SPHN|nr:hypothetical protein [Erythrobacter dokdonensis]OBV11897.1 hypothetical protein I603_0028 [Erythrobacter dokdonensis DSW-74]